MKKTITFTVTISTEEKLTDEVVKDFTERAKEHLQFGVLDEMDDYPGDCDLEEDLPEDLEVAVEAS